MNLHVCWRRGIVCDLAIALTLAHHSAKDFIFASSIDLLLALGAAWAAYAALSYRRWGVTLPRR